MYAPQPTIHHFIIMISSRTRRLGGWAFETVFLTDTRIPKNLPLGKYVGTVAYGTVSVDMYLFIPIVICRCPTVPCADAYDAHAHVPRISLTRSMMMYDTWGVRGRIHVMKVHM